MQRSTFVDEWLGQGRIEGRVEGRIEGLVLGRAESRALLHRMGKKKFGRPPTKKQKAELDSINDPARLQALSERSLAVTTRGELLAD